MRNEFVRETNSALGSNEMCTISHVTFKKRALWEEVFFLFPLHSRRPLPATPWDHPNPTTTADSVMIKRPGPEDKTSLYHCATLGQRPSLPEPQFSHLYNGGRGD